MRLRLLLSISVLAAAAVPLTAQTAAPKRVTAKAATGAKKPVILRTPWGDPDLQGVWNDATGTPLQRPAEVGEKDVFNDDEAAQFREQLAHDQNLDRRDGGPEVDVARSYNEHWMDSGRLNTTPDRRTSLIVDPPDGRFPSPVPLSPERAQRRAARGAAATRLNGGLPESFMDFSLPERCIIRTDSPPYLPFIYNNNFQIFQSPGYVVIAPEMIHSARIIPVDGRPHLGKNLRQWLGDSRGHWEGDTLVVETINFRTDDGVIFRGANPDTYKITERFTRVNATAVNYEFTIDDPQTWKRPWTARIPWIKIDPGEQIYEYACHEDNYDMVHFLAAARAREKKGETK